MGKVEIAEEVFEGETKAAPATQSDTTGTETRPSILGKLHRYASVCARLVTVCSGPPERPDH